MDCSPTAQAQAQVTWMEGRITVLEDCMAIANDIRKGVENKGFYLEEMAEKLPVSECSTVRDTITCLTTDLRNRLIDIRMIIESI